MTLVLIEVDMSKIRQFPIEWVPEQIDYVLKPHHMKWAYGNYYGVEEGYDAEVAVKGALEALAGTVWLKAALHVRVVRLVVKRKLSAIDVASMKPPAQEKLEKFRAIYQDKELLENKLAFPNPIVIDEENRLTDGYTTYLLMQERGLKEAMCILVKS